jgi:hypothetical protein
MSLVGTEFLQVTPLRWDGSPSPVNETTTTGAIAALALVAPAFLGNVSVAGTLSGVQVNLTGNLYGTSPTFGIEIGSFSAPGSPYFDWHTSGSANDYDFRMIASGGTAGTIGLGTLTMFGLTLNVAAPNITLGQGLANYVFVQGVTAGNPVKISASGTDANIDVAMVPKGTGTLRAPSLNTGGIGGSNRIINGNFSVNQRLYASGNALAAGVYGLDRWKAGASGCTLTSNGAIPDTTITITAGTLQQTIESVWIEGGAYTLSWAGTATARVNGGAYLSSPITVAGLTAGANQTVEFGTGTVGKVMLTPGSQAVAYERRAPTVETQLCQRYYILFPTIGAWGYGPPGGNVVAGYSLPVTMRVAPTAAFGATLTSANTSGAFASSTNPGWFNVYVTVAALGPAFMTAALSLTAEL